MAQAAYVLRMTSGLGVGGSESDGNILRRTITMGEPQQVHSSWGRGVGMVAGVGAPTGCLNTNNLNNAIKRLLLLAHGDRAAKDIAIHCRATDARA